MSPQTAAQDAGSGIFHRHLRSDPPRTFRPLTCSLPAVGFNVVSEGDTQVDYTRQLHHRRPAGGLCRCDGGSWHRERLEHDARDVHLNKSRTKEA